MQVQAIVYVTDMDRSIEWYSTLLGASPSMASEHWTTFEVGGAVVALHASGEVLAAGNVALSLVAPAPLEDAASVVDGEATIVDQPFGRSFTVTDPDGLLIQVNEHHQP